MNDFTKPIPIPVREVVRSGAESTRMEAGAGSCEVRGTSNAARIAHGDDAPKIERATDRKVGNE